MDKKSVKKILLAKWTFENEAWFSYINALETISDDVMPKWDGKPCNNKFAAALYEAVGNLCEVEIFHHTKDLKQISLRSRSKYYTTDNGRKIRINNTVYNVAVKFDMTGKTPRISAADTINEIEMFSIPFIREEMLKCKMYIDNIDYYIKANEKVIKAVTDYMSKFVPLDMRVLFDIKNPALLGDLI